MRRISLQHVARVHVCGVGVSDFVLVEIEARELSICTDLHARGLEHELALLIVGLLLFMRTILRDRRQIARLIHKLENLLVFLQVVYILNLMRNPRDLMIEVDEVRIVN